MGTTTKKRPAPSAQGASKKRKVAPSSKKGAPKTEGKKYNVKPKEKGKEKAADRGIIPIPSSHHDGDDDSNLSDQDQELLNEYGSGALTFLDNLDQKGILRSKKETDRLHQLSKPVRKAPSIDDLPSVDSHDEGSWSSGLEDDDAFSSSDEDEDADDADSLGISDDDSDIEMPYETAPRPQPQSWKPEKKKGVERLPIKLSDGRVLQTGSTNAPPVSDDEASDSEASDGDENGFPDASEARVVEDVSTGARFGRPAVIDIIANKSRSAKIQAAKEQIASICQEIVAEPENSLGLLRRLHTFSLSEISTPTHPEPVPNDTVVRKLAMASQLAVFKDIIPGYRIRALTDKEKAEKVSQMVAQTRDWEQGLVTVYQTYLRALDAEVKARNELSTVALQCMCSLLSEVTHFNFRVNLMSSIVARLSRKSWDESSDLCLNTLIKVFREDLTGQASMEIVRLLNRMIKERRFNVHPDVLTCLLHLRLKTELGVRASDSRTDKPESQPSHKGKRRGTGNKAVDQPHLSKKAKKALKEKKAIEREFRDAEAEVDKEERAVTQTETLKLVFVLYFRILKNERRTPLLPAALRGIAKFAHQVNIDFFKDLMTVLKDLISRDSEDSMTDSDENVEKGVARSDPSIFGDIHHRLLCIVTAFELLSGQGEALNLDLSDFVTRLYALILPLSLMPDIDVAPGVSTRTGHEASSTSSASASTSHPTRSTSASNKQPPARGATQAPSPSPSVADLLFQSLALIFGARAVGGPPPPWRAAAFAKRLLTAALQWPSGPALRALAFAKGVIARDGALEALLTSAPGDRVGDGVYRADVDDPQLCHPLGACLWEVHVLRRSHPDGQVRAVAAQLANYVRG
ncbi:hypothetical protein HGRIS_013095 [Hohenbuehelia grisea]|uniref:Nucleolar complex-associated protein 3 n=1 Tax=Hohenbuehelia grisea TaxID=104357 RepID=A0ABR3IUN8_9AGAR